MSNERKQREMEHAAKLFAVHVRDVLDPLVYPERAGLSVSASLLPDVKADPIGPAAAMRLPYERVDRGWRWGPKWATCWFRVVGEVPDRLAGRTARLRFSSGTEALVWVTQRGGGWTPRQGLDVNRDAVSLWEGDRAPAGAKIDVLIEAACNHPFGVIGFEWDDPEVHHRWESPTPGRLERAELAVYDEAAWRVRHAFAFALGLMKELPANSDRAQQLLAGLRWAMAVDVSRAEGRVRAIKGLERLIAVAPAGSATLCHAVGHAHLDTGWLWPVRETKRKLLRTFSNQLRLMERYPEYVFLASQAQHYAWVEAAEPALFAEITARVAEGRWQPGGGMWVEPDINCIDGESIVRQVLHADRYWRSRFGAAGKQKFLYLPDTFGFGAALPQVMALSGLKMFVTNKLSWNDTNPFPHTTFWWEGLDGTEVLAHQTPGHDYNATNTPRELKRGEANHKAKDLWTGDGSTAAATPGRSPEQATAAVHWLQPFGYGDGGGGAVDWSIQYALWARSCDGLARVRLGGAHEFVDTLSRQAVELEQAGIGTGAGGWPVWCGELYLELHRGTLTTQAWIKAANRRAESRLRLAETLAVVRGEGRTPQVAALDRAWKLLMLNQFHDILPGSSIGWVYEDAAREYEEIDTAIAAVTRESPAPAPDDDARVVFNPTLETFSGVLEVDGEARYLGEIPGLSARSLREASSAVDDASAVVCGERPAGFLSMTNGRVAVTITTDDSADIQIGAASAAAGPDRSAGGAGAAGVSGSGGGGGVSAAHRLALYEDRPIMWDAWDIDASYPQREVVATPRAQARVRWLRRDRVRSEVEISRPIGDRSHITQVIRLDAASARVDVLNEIDWNEDHRLLRAVIPTMLGPAAVCRHGTHFGWMSRATHRSTSFERARFEFPVQGWIELAEGGRGIALLTPEKYGCSVEGGTLGLSLLRAPTHPDPKADRGVHRFSYAIVPLSPQRPVDVAAEAEKLIHPIRVLPKDALRSAAGRAWMKVSCSGGAAIGLSAIKWAQDDDRVIVRVYERAGLAGAVRIDWGVPVADVSIVDLLEGEEHAAPVDGFRHHRVGHTEFAPRAFQIVTMAVRLG